MGFQYRIHTVEKITSSFIISMAEQQKVFRILNTIVNGAHGTKRIIKIMLEFVKIQLAKSDMKLC